MSYDKRVYDLVEIILRETPEKNSVRNRRLLAQHIQDELEDWIIFMLPPSKDEETAS